MNSSLIERGLLGLCFALFAPLSIGCGGEDEPASEQSDENVERPDAGPSDEDADDDKDPPASTVTRDSGAAPAKDAGTTAEPPKEPFKPPTGSQELLLRTDSFLFNSPEIVLRPFGREAPVTAEVQKSINASLVSDTTPDNNMDGLANAGDGDGVVDMNLIFRFRASGPATVNAGSIETGSALCKHPFDPSQSCPTDPAGPFQKIAEKYENQTDCKLAGTTEVATGPCFVTEVGRMMLELPLLGPVPLEEAQLVGSWADGGAGGIKNGFVRGFLSQEVARATKLGSDLPALAVALDIKPGTELALFFSDGALKTNSAGVPGWWFAIRFSAKPISME
jgi:hypothetical protein